VPLVAIVPLQPPEAVQEVALVDDHFKVVVPPWVTLAGVAVSETKGAGAETLTVAD
jgi:hypothetical protein